MATETENKSDKNFNLDLNRGFTPIEQVNFQSGQQRSIFRTQTVEVNTQVAGVQQINIPDIQNLRDVNVWGIEFYVGKAAGGIEELDKTPSNKPIYTAAEMQGAFATFVDYASYSFIKDAPILNFVPWLYQGVGNQSVWKFTGQKINWNKSYIFLNSAATAKAGTAFFFNVYYTLDLATEMETRKLSFATKK